MQSLSQQFLEWCRRKPADETFKPWAGSECAGFQFMQAMGAPVAFFGISTWDDTEGGYHATPKVIRDAINWATDQAPYPSGVLTFGALADHLTEQVPA